MVVSLLERTSFLKRNNDISSALSDYLHAEIMHPLLEKYDPLKNKLQEWLSEIGLDLNPFEYIDSGKDPLIPFYLIEHKQFDNLSGDQPSFVFAPAGGGKTAFRVRLARECRAGRNGRRIFPIVYKPSEPGSLDEEDERSALRQRTDLLRFAAQELFLHLVYYPYVLDEMDDTLKGSLLQIISWDLDFPISYYLEQMKEVGSLEPVINAFDPTARSLPNPPGKQDITYLCKKLSRYTPSSGGKPDSENRLNKLFDLVLNKLNFEAVYILVDGVDAFFETVNNPEYALASISWLLGNTLPWMQSRIYVKYFLPIETQPSILGTSYRLLTSKSKIVIIKWDADALSEVIRQRLQEASGGKFDSLAAISDRSLRASGRSIEEILIDELRKHKRVSPRSLVRAVNWLLMNHVRDQQGRDKLTPQDLKAVREWIRSEYSAKE